MDAFTAAYIRTALWSSSDDAGNPLDEKYDSTDIDPVSLALMQEHCQTFQAKTADLINVDPTRAGQDFWLTRNGHGAGFWDGDWEKDTGDALTAAAKTYGSADLYIGDDGKIYHS